MKLVDMEIDHVSHPAHKLVYYEAVTTRGEMGNMITNCAACADEISSEHYGCEDCNFFLHKLCAVHPSESTHSLHPLHPLRLLHKSPYGDELPCCGACKKTAKGFIYHCSICCFDLDFICTLIDGSKLNHISHPEHVLTYEKVLKPSKNGVVCAGCLYEISGHSKEHYCCLPCNFFLHKLCAERPLKLTHSLHPLHSLQLHFKNPHANNNAHCHACKKALKSFVYHCKICDFDLDLICAFPDGPKLNHFSHPDHVLTFEKAVKRFNKDVVCVVCLDEISGQSSEHYSCRPCNIFIHKLCAQAPRELTHSSHTLHPLQFIPKNPYSYYEEAPCDICKVILKGFLYHCEPCEFTVHLRCALPDLKPDYSSVPGGSKLNHFCHPHILTFEKVVKRKDKRLSCAACLYEISGLLADYYSCRHCNFFLHKLCAERPMEFTHSLHPQHPLHLVQKDYSVPGSFACGACQKPMKGFVYDCRQCMWGFFIDFKCAFTGREKRIQKFEQVHDHPLAFIPRTSKFICDICSSTGEDEEDQSYACLTCDFLIHKSCAQKALTEGYKDHQHPLSLVHGVPEDLQIYEGFCCDLCHNRISQEDLVSHCARCRYFVHVRCIIFDDTSNISTIKDAVDYLDDSLIKLILNGDKFVHWPAKDISLELIQPFLLGNDGKMVDVQQKIRHLSHEQHDMILFNKLCVNTDSFFKEEDEEILCDACIHPISAPYYCCQECKYYLHSSCANLPSKIHHFSHPHELKLSFPMRFHTFRCDQCVTSCNGFGYLCETCEFILDLTCAALPAFIMHETHDHPLFQMKAEDEGLCYACHVDTEDGDQIFKCRFCDLYIHYSCAMHSRSIRHRWDRQHPLGLRFPPHGDHPDHFMCDMCEELIHPLHWLYSCFKCDVSFHCRCAPKYHGFQDTKYGVQNIKYGGEVQISSHPHILKHVNEPTLKTIKCDKCEDYFYFEGVFECETCYQCICFECVIKEI